MNRFFYREAPIRKVNYLPWPIVPVLAFGVAMLFTHTQQTQTIFEALKNNRFWIACIWSFLPTLLLIVYLQVVSSKLDAHWCWRKHFGKRLKRQIILGLILPAGFLATYYTCYYAAYGESAIDRKYFQIEFPMAIFALLGLNLGYAFFYLYKLDKQTDQSYEESMQLLQEENTLLLEANNSYVAKAKYLENVEMASKSIYPHKFSLRSNGVERTVVAASIICLMRWSHVGLMLLDDGNVFIVDNSLDQISRLLDNCIYTKNNRWCIVNLKHIAYTVPYANNARKLVYKQKTATLLDSMEERELKLLEKYKDGSYNLSDKYILNRSFWKSMEMKLKALE